MPFEMELHGKKAVVFGGTSGIGLATVKRLVAAGASVVAVSRTPEDTARLEYESDLEGVRKVACDVTDEAAVEKVCEAEAPFDVLISTATGGKREMGPFLKMNLDGYKGSFAKLWGYAHVLRHGGPHVRAGGAVVLVSGAPARGPKRGQASLSTVGASVEQLVRCVAPEFAEREVRINVVSPGMIDTPLFSGPMREEKLETATSATLIPRPGRADEVAHAVMFAVTNTYSTGNTIDVDGGWLAGR